MKYYIVLDAMNNPYAFTPSESGAKTVAKEINGKYREATEKDLED